MVFKNLIRYWQNEVCVQDWFVRRIIGIKLMTIIVMGLPLAAITALPVQLNAVEFVKNASDYNNGDVQEIANLSITRDVYGMAWSPKGKYLAAYWGSTITIWDTETWAKVREFVRKEGGAVVETKFGFSSDEDDLSKCFNLTEWNLRAENFVMGQPFTASNDHRLVAGALQGPDYTLSVLDIRTGKTLFARSIPIDWGVDLSESISSKNEMTTALAFSADGKRLAVGTSSEQRTKLNKTLAGGGRVYILDSKTGWILNSFWAYRWEPDYELDRPDESGWILYRPKDIYEVSSITFSPDAQWVVTGKDRRFNTKTGNTIAATIWNARTGVKVVDIEGDVFEDKVLDMALVTPIREMAWHDDCLAMINICGSCRLYSVQDPRNPRLLFKSKGLWMAQSSHLSVSGKGLVAYCNGNHIHVLKLNNH